MKNKIIVLRKEGYPYKVIAKMIGCSPSTVYKYGKNIKPLCKIKSTRNNAAATKAARDKWVAKKDAAIREAIEEWPTLKQDPQFMGFLGLYWGEGTKSGRKTVRICVANMDPSIILFCYNYLLDLTSNRIRCWVLCCEEHAELAEHFWEQLLRIPVAIRCRKPIKPIKRETGICYIRVNDWRLYHKIITWLECWEREIMAA